MLSDRVAYCVLFINWRNSGWSERYWLPTSDWIGTRALADKLARWRIAGCAQGCKIIWGRIGFSDDWRLSWPITALGITSRPYAGMGGQLINTVWTRINWRFETADGRWVIRQWGGVPDDLVRAAKIVGQLEPLPTDDEMADLADHATPWRVAYTSMVRFFFENTVFAGHGRDWPDNLYDVEPWNRILVRGVGNRNTGRDFLRVSWETARTRPANQTGVDPPTDAAPAFTPCGAAVGVVRAAYSRVCQWYVNGPLGRIRYYFVPETNKVLPYKTVFWPYSQVLDLQNLTQTGERPAAGYRWDRGVPTHWLDGSHPHGTEQDFMGTSAVPWTPAVPTPLFELPQCDFGPELGTHLEVGGAGLFGAVLVGHGGVEISGSGFESGLEIGGAGPWHWFYRGARGVEAGGPGPFGPGLAGSGGVELGDAGGFASSYVGAGGVEVGGPGPFGPGLAGAGGVELGGAGGFLPAPWIGSGGVELGGAGSFAGDLAGGGGAELGGGGDFP